MTQLRPYQQAGLDWLQFLRAFDLGGLLADDMGLGKTVQTLAHVLVEKRAGRLDRPCLVVCPTSVVPNWCAEAARLAPELRVLSLHGSDRAARFGEIPGSDLVVTTYALLPRDADRLLPIAWHIAVLDESQAIKNVAAKATQLVCRLDARHRLCLTGTPVENHLGELWSQFAFLMPGLLGDAKRFARVFRNPIEKRQNGDRRAVLAARVKPFLLRRTKAVVAADLPAKSEIPIPLELAGPQRDLYETVRLAMHRKVREEVAAKGFARSQIVVLDALLKLRQVCCDPRLVKLAAARGVSASVKLAHLLETLPPLIEAGRRILLFSQFTAMLDLIKPQLAQVGIDFVELRGDTADRAGPVARFQTGKVPLFLISLRAGGTGLNLTAADTVIHYDPWWNPAVEDQATDRAHRIGQKKAVFVYKMVTQGTVEERMIALQERKRALACAIGEARDPAGPLLDTTDIERLFAPLSD
jgi:SNF2 family DNA or RNA helicase